MPRQPGPSSQESRATPKAGNAREELLRLYRLHLSDPTNDDLREEFAKFCTEALRKKVAHCVYAGNCPRFLAPSTFAEDAFSLALVKFWTGIHAVRNPKELNAWLSKVASSAVFEELRDTTRRKKDGPCTWEGLEPEARDAEGVPINILDDERNRQAAERNGTLTAASSPDLKQLIRQDILHKLLRANGNGSKRQYEGSRWLALILALDLTVDEIARRRGTTKADVWRLLSASRMNMKRIAGSRYNFTAKDL